MLDARLEASSSTKTRVAMSCAMAFRAAQSLEGGTPGRRVGGRMAALDARAEQVEEHVAEVRGRHARVGQRISEVVGVWHDREVVQSCCPGACSQQKANG